MCQIAAEEDFALPRGAHNKRLSDCIIKKSHFDFSICSSVFTFLAHFPRCARGHRSLRFRPNKHFEAVRAAADNFSPA